MQEVQNRILCSLDEEDYCWVVHCDGESWPGKHLSERGRVLSLSVLVQCRVATLRRDQEACDQEAYRYGQEPYFVVSVAHLVALVAQTLFAYPCCCLSVPPVSAPVAPPAPQ